MKGVTIRVNSESEFLMYLHDKGEEYYLHYDFWPNVPYTHHAKKEEFFTDMVVKKDLEVLTENCEQTNHSYFGKLLVILLFNSLFLCYIKKVNDHHFVIYFYNNYLSRLLAEVV